MRIKNKEEYKSWVKKQLEKAEKRSNRQKCSPKTRKLSKR